MKGPVVQDTECLYFPTTTIDITATVELSFEVPCNDFDTAKIRDQLNREKYGLLGSVRLNKTRLAYALGMEGEKFIQACTHPNIDITRITITKYNAQGNTIHEKE